jgi:hypothetical protein
VMWRYVIWNPSSERTRTSTRPDFRSIDCYSIKGFNEVWHGWLWREPHDLATLLLS